MKSLLNELVQKISEVNPSIDLVEIETHFTSILYKYNIEYKNNNINNDNNLSYYVDMFLSIKKLEGLSKLTLDGYKIEMRIFNNYINKPLTAITSYDIRAYLSQFSHLKQSSIGRKISVLKSFFQVMIDEEIIIKNPMSKIKTPKKEKRLPKSLNEISQLNISDINWRNLSIKVLGKGNSERVVYFNFKSAYHLKKYLNNRKDDCEALFVTERKPYRRLSNRGIQRIFNNLGNRTNIELHVHKCRHTCAGNLLNNGADLALVQEILGHKHPSTTQIYCQLSEQNKYDGYRRYAR